MQRPWKQKKAARWAWRRAALRAAAASVEEEEEEEITSVLKEIVNGVRPMVCGKMLHPDEFDQV